MKVSPSLIFEMRDVSKSYGEATAVSHVSFSIRDGEFLSIIGPSGGGKSTILKMVAGVIAPSSGSMTFRGEDVSALSAGDHRRVMVWQSLALFPHMSVEGNVGFGLSVRKVPRPEREHRVAESLEMVNLAGYQKRHVQELSGGEQQRVALARAIVVEPDMILLDEPFGALDVHLRARLLEKIRDIHHSTRLTFVMVTHDQADALYVSTRIAVLNRGQLEQVSDPDEILRRPQSAFVAQFVGRKNVIAGTVRGVAGGVATVATAGGEFSGAIPDWISAEFRAGMPVVYVIEAHKTHVGTKADKCLTGRLEGRVLDGSREILEVRAPGLDHILKCERPSVEDREMAFGSEIDLSWKPTEAYVLPRRDD